QDQNQRQGARPSLIRAVVRTKPRIGEEDRQEEHPDDRRNVPLSLLDEAPVIVEGHTDDKAPDDPEDTQVARDGGRDEEEGHDVRDGREPELAVSRDVRRDGPLEGPPHDKEHEDEDRKSTRLN